MAKAVCLDDVGIERYVTKGRIYDIQICDGQFITVLNSNYKTEVNFYSYRFKILNCNCCDYRKCNNCPMDNQERKK